MSEHHESIELEFLFPLGDGLPSKSYIRGCACTRLKQLNLTGYFIPDAGSVTVRLAHNGTGDVRYFATVTALRGTAPEDEG